MANLLTAVRLLLVVPFAWLIANGNTYHPIFAAAAMATAIVTDILDGRVARQRGTASAWGGTFDHAADFLFVTGGLAAGATRGVFPWILPVLIAAAFAQYVIDSYWFHRQRKLRASRLGRYNGILYFAPLCLEILVRLGLTALRPLLLPLAWLLVASTLVSMVDRFTAVRTSDRKAAKAPSREGAGRPS